MNEEERDQWIRDVSHWQAKYQTAELALKTILARAKDCVNFDADNLHYLDTDHANANAYTFTTRQYWLNRKTLSDKWLNFIKECIGNL